MPYKMSRSSRKMAPRKGYALYRQPTVRPDGIYKEKIKMIVDVQSTVASSGGTSPVWGHYNVHHTLPF